VWRGGARRPGWVSGAAPGVDGDVTPRRHDADHRCTHHGLGQVLLVKVRVHHGEVGVASAVECYLVHDLEPGVADCVVSGEHGGNRQGVSSVAAFEYESPTPTHAATLRAAQSGRIG
jgi:hypothetical protein